MAISDRGRQYLDVTVTENGLSRGVVSGDPLCPTDMRCDMEELMVFEQAELREEVIMLCYPPITSQLRASFLEGTGL